MPDAKKQVRRTRFARLYPDGSLGVDAGGVDFFDARRRLLGSTDDDDTELLEIEVTVIRTHGRPKMQQVREHSAVCPTCGDTVYFEVADA